MRLACCRCLVPHTFSRQAKKNVRLWLKQARKKMGPFRRRRKMKIKIGHFAVGELVSGPFRHSLFFLSYGGWGKIKLRVTKLPRIFIRVVSRLNSVVFATQR